MFQILVYFLCKNCNSPEKGHPPSPSPLFPSNPTLKIEILLSLLFFKFVGGSTPPPPPLQQKGEGEGGAHDEKQSRENMLC